MLSVLSVLSVPPSVEVDDPGWTGDAPHPGFAVRYASPAEGVVASSPAVALAVDGTEVSVRDRSRFANRYTRVGPAATTIPIADDVGRWTLDLAAGTRGAG